MNLLSNISILYDSPRHWVFSLDGSVTTIIWVIFIFISIILLLSISVVFSEIIKDFNIPLETVYSRRNNRPQCPHEMRYHSISHGNNSRTQWYQCRLCGLIVNTRRVG